MSDDGPIRVCLGSYPIADAVTIPAEILRAADEEITRERERRGRAAERAAAEREASAKGWRGWLRSLWRRS